MHISSLEQLVWELSMLEKMLQILRPHAGPVVFKEWCTQAFGRLVAMDGLLQ